MKKLNDFIAACQAELSYNETAKKAFHTKGKAVLREVAKAADLTAKVTSNLGGIAVSGEVKLKTSKLEISVGEIMGTVKVMYRTLENGRSGTNQWTTVDRLLDEAFISKLAAMEAA